MRLAKLTATAVKNLKKLGLHNDGGGLYLKVTKQGTKSWIFRWRDRGTGRLRDMGLGSVNSVPLKTARDLAANARELVARGSNPRVERDRERAERRAAERGVLTFDQCAAAYIEAHAPSWTNDKHKAQWKSTLKTYVSPHLGDLTVSDVAQDDVLRCLEPIWTTKTETATRVRQRIEAVLDYARARGLRTGENPARWKGRLDKLLPKPSKLKGDRHHAALPHSQVAGFLQELREEAGAAARCLEFTILTGARTGESINTHWTEIDFKFKVWTIPAERMKAGKDHRVPLSPATIRLLKAQQGHDDVYVFPGLREGKPLSNMAMLETLRRMGKKDVTVHGFRSTFRDWAAEVTRYPREVCEMALAHTLGNATEAAYFRSDLFEKRRKLMADWARYCNSKPATGDKSGR